ncbi:MAG: S-layer homology domain-containing protein, partial [Gudongella sp.]|nr:S-layer homology domain-containing protein [Gudongella sp.]
DEFKVEYIAGENGSIEGTTPQTVSYNGSTTEVTATPDEGYHFVGWSDESTLVARSESNVTANATYTATFEKDEFKVEYIAGENGSIEGTTPQTVSYNGSTTEVTATPDEGYHFVGWSDENTVATRSETNVKANATYTANFGKDQFTVTFLDYNESTLKSEQVAYGEDATPPEDPEREGYTFAGWDGKYTSVTKNETVIATYTSNQFPTINYIAGIGGAVTNANEKIEEILEVALGSKAIANTGYTFQNWTRDGVIVSTNENFIPVRVDGIYEAATYKANFAKNVYTVTFLDYNESTLKSEQVAYGEDATPPAEPEREGYTFAGWNGEYTNVIQNTTIIATYTSSEEELNVTINYIAGTGGTVTNTIEIIEGISEVAKGSIATANTGYTFKNWTKNGVVVSTSANFIPVAVEGVYEAATYTANFTAITSGGGGGGSGGGSGGSSETIDEEIPETLPELNREDHFQYIQGYPDNTVRPEGKVTREEVAAVFYRLLANDYRETIKTSAQGFNDVNESRWSAKHIATLANGKIVDGYLDGSFKPGKYITRAELATIASRFDNLSPFESNSFSDVEGHWANEYINSAAQKGWLNGYPDGTFKPNQEITRAEFVTLVNNVLERRVQKENILENSKVFPDLGEDKWYYEAMEEAINSHFYTRLEDSFEKWEEIYFPEIDM